jgi:hypothetical protein
LLLFFIVAIPMAKVIKVFVEAIKPGFFDIDLNVDEDLNNYFEALEESDKNQMIKEEENLRNNYVSL